jgi:hypothetical protein
MIKEAKICEDSGCPRIAKELMNFVCSTTDFLVPVISDFWRNSVKMLKMGYNDLKDIPDSWDDWKVFIETLRVAENVRSWMDELVEYVRYRQMEPVTIPYTASMCVVISEKAE